MPHEAWHVAPLSPPGIMRLVWQCIVHICLCPILYLDQRLVDVYNAKTVNGPGRYFAAKAHMRIAPLLYGRLKIHERVEASRRFWRHLSYDEYLRWRIADASEKNQ